MINIYDGVQLNISRLNQQRENALAFAFVSRYRLEFDARLHLQIGGNRLVRACVHPQH